MDANFFQSWKFALLITAVGMIAISGYRIVFGKDLATRMAETRIARSYPNGVPSDLLMNRQVAAATPYVSVQFTLGQLSRYFTSINYIVGWEPVNERAFVLRARAEDALTKQKMEWAFQLVSLEGPQVGGQLIGTFTGPAVAIESAAYNRENVSEEDLAALLIEIIPDVRQQPRQ